MGKIQYNKTRKGIYQKMRKRNIEKFILLLVIFLLLFAIFPMGSKAASDLELKQINYDAILQEDGNMDVEETWHIRITQVNTLYKTFHDTAEGATDVEVEEILPDGRAKKFSQIHSYRYHLPVGSYAATENPDGDFEIAWGVSARNVVKVYKVRYTIQGAVTRYQDMAELYWKFVGEENEIPIQSLTGTIKLPQEVTKKENLRGWVHGPLQGNLEVQSDGITFACQNINPQTYIEPRIAVLEPEMFSKVEPKQTNQFQTVLSQEMENADRANRKRKMYQTWKWAKEILKVIISIGIFIFGLVKIVQYIQKIKRTKKIVATTKFDYYRELPKEDATPADAAFLYYQSNITTKMPDIISATLLDLALKGYIGFQMTGKEDICMELIEGKDKQDLKEDERVIYEILERALAKVVQNKEKKVLTMQEIQRYAKKYSTVFQTKINQVRPSCEERQSSLGNYDEKQAKAKVEYQAYAAVYLLLALIGIPLSIAIFSWGVIAAILLLINSILCFILSRKINSLTQQGEDERAKWIGLKNYMRDFSMLDERSVPELVLWEKYLVYATAFGIAEKVLKELKVKYPELTQEEITDGTYGYLPLLYRNGMFQTMFLSSLNSGVSAAYYAGTAPTDNYSSGGGFGGGFSGGGGRRRRRWPEWAEDKKIHNKTQVELLVSFA